MYGRSGSQTARTKTNTNHYSGSALRSLSARNSAQATPGGRNAAPPTQTAAAAKARGWEGQGFYVQIERCCGLSEKAVSVRHDEEKYVRISNGIKEHLELFFDGQLPVEVIDVPTPYAMEIRIMPETGHPSHGVVYTGVQAEALGAQTVFSKIKSKKWPKLETLRDPLIDLCCVPVQIKLLGRSIRKDRLATASVESMSPGVEQNQEASPLTPQASVVLQCMHLTSGATFSRRLTTGPDGYVETVLFPGQFAFECEEESFFDRLEPGMITVPAHSERLEVEMTVAMKKTCTLLIVDHLHRPFPKFPVYLQPREKQAPGMKPVALRTKMDGKCRVRVCRGIYIATYDIEPSNRQPLVHAFQQDLEVQHTDDPQFFRIVVNRIRYAVEIMLRTHFGISPTAVPFVVRNSHGEPVAQDLQSSEAGVASFDVPPGFYVFKLEPSEESPFVQAKVDIDVRADGTFHPSECKVETKNVDIRIYLVTPDGQPAPNCLFHLSPQFAEEGAGLEMAFRSDGDGVAMATIGLLEPYIFKVKHTGRVMEYMPQLFAFQTDRRSFTVVVARAILGHIPEERVALVVDTSGSMQVYLEDIKVAINSTLVHQFHKSKKTFNIITFSEGQVMFRPQLVECAPTVIEDAMSFCESMRAGGGSGAKKALERVFSIDGLDAAYLITDGKCELGDALMNHVRKLFFAHPKRPKLNLVGINCVPRGHTWRGLHSMAALTQGVFRPVCLEQDQVDAVAAWRADRRGFSQDSFDAGSIDMLGEGSTSLMAGNSDAGVSQAFGIDLMSPQHLAVTSDDCTAHETGGGETTDADDGLSE
eukprot:TRINITY_DN41548_c0_g1_i1.p1 TRINITY_DN41548_c0_g1~~TRINITY_DN41548_c0_g1_i1.p1  ORF type:complete len:815 (+),score=86.70 TRINITY_DN41548_c0_g1_i1:185-2629(+)